MGQINKSVRLDTDLPRIQEFIDKQSNFSKAIKYLIFEYCCKNQEIEDLAKKYKATSQMALMSQIVANLNQNTQSAPAAMVEAVTQQQPASPSSPQPEAVAEVVPAAAEKEQPQEAEEKSKKVKGVDLNEYSEYID